MGKRHPNQKSPFVIRSDGSAGLASLHTWDASEPPKATKLDLEMANILDGIDIEHCLLLGPPSPERLFCQRLQLAVLQDAYEILRTGGYSASRDDWVRDVWWAQGYRKSARGFSLHDICVSLGFEYKRVRSVLLQLAESAPPGRPKKQKGAKRETRANSLHVAEA